MEVIRLPERRLYWSTESNGLFPAFNFERYVTINRFEEFLNFWQLSDDNDNDEQVLAFIDAVNAHLKETLQPGEELCIDGSMIKAYHKNLKGKMKISRSVDLWKSEKLKARNFSQCGSLISWKNNL